jgi:hypothetical protein
VSTTRRTGRFAGLHLPTPPARDPRPHELQDPRPPARAPSSQCRPASPPLSALPRLPCSPRCARLCSALTAAGHDSVAVRRDLVMQLGRERDAKEEKDAAMAAGLRLERERGGGATDRGRRQGYCRHFNTQLFCAFERFRSLYCGTDGVVFTFSYMSHVPHPHQ